ncbi:16S rRNA (adenine(1518)-N(6)/adenine(1519)-N(6))-dimethyltransferase RsmA [Naumannella halotolerans]|uniref:Ribosomal RNA small subunit methyltransferase A n=1 Tax=Naumannella halotolerans TaxID=993414 RepID=A0A4R7J5M5_9ACTN|nr:16S rRNA (adenine(1518)-N(6)/adenine(1519)-N(6))-dimethyltransferase RsmA [Naumannella halotolerans]TDT32514.1 16S rRNA (adenine1518-N6/adenine1519-N6)-dimethyltransferase [Naumannella halotolerans]
MPAALLDPRTIRELAAGLDLRPTKQRGQNFVHDANTVRRIVTAAELTPAEPVLEIGPGLGSLTLGLLEAGHPVTAIEIDDRLAGLLPQTVAERLPSAHLQVITADALTVTDLPDPAPTALVANLPYNVSVPVLLTMFERFDSLRSGLVMVQAEVADRLAAPPGSRTYGVPSAKIAWYSRARRVGTVPPKVFWPVPNVESGLVRLGRHDPPPTTATRQQVFAVVDAAFAQRRKMLRSALSGLFGGSAAAAEALTEAGVDPQARGESIDIAGFARIAERIG